MYMNSTAKNVIRSIAVLCLIMFSSCGGGGGASDSTTTPIGTLGMHIGCNGVGCGNSGDLVAYVKNSSGTVTNIKIVASQTLASGSPIDITLQAVPVGTHHASAYLDKDLNHSLTSGDAVAPLEMIVVITSGQTGTASFDISQIQP